MKNQRTYHSKKVSELLSLVKENDPLATTEVYNRYIKYISHIVSNIVKNQSDAEEIVQDVFIKAFSSLDLYQKDLSFGYWLAKIAKNKSIDHIRRVENQLDEINMEDDSLLKDNDSLSVSSELIRKHEKEHLLQLVEQLRWKDRRIFKLRYEDNLKYEEIAEKLNVTVGTIKSHLHNVKDKLIKLNEKTS